MATQRWECQAEALCREAGCLFMAGNNDAAKRRIRACKLGYLLLGGSASLPSVQRCKAVVVPNRGSSGLDCLDKETDPRCEAETPLMHLQLIEQLVGAPYI